MNTKDLFTETLRRHKQSVTHARLAVFTALQNQEPLTMHELIQRVSAIDRASVYRTIALFEQFGIVERLQTGWKYKLELSDTFHAHHHHATCVNCGTSYVLPENPTLEDQLQQMTKPLGFHVERHQVELSGTCSTCYAINVL